ncbi:MAG: bifunctional diaminohydroxyphosphoribosylaminopyrimidine deaminase/5-amino-6-(5-phosphoribosylamino)uracil reductase RibD [Hyphomicrobium sp.]|nr:bifunctional diaminohydroxyphosphoribosylaminopyrimidine deaminase/5-amino-6-(5-phosphoribosylamino)uracil reductase RibD [Hyphomicrobium sp.]PPD05991.1 MAG: riboflavin biosynthesis protein RibD [Hyphomicrobium sp.]
MTAAPSPFDLDMMRIALRIAARGLGNAAPNPAVGAVIADEATGEVIARGWTQPGGRPHAETEAIRRAGSRARGATLYVTLEPCAHFGKTPPCADAIVAAGVKRVVVGTGDPDPRTAGEGIAKLRTAGVNVTENVLEPEARWLTLGHILRITQKRPFVALKIATDGNGHIAPGDGTAPRWVTGAEARASGHLLRAESDAILIGAGTLRADNPDLTCRLPGLAHRSPVRVVLAGRSALDPTAKLFSTATQTPVLIVRAGTALPSDHDLAATGAHVLELPDQNIATVLEALAARGITRLLVEGGPAVWRSFAESGFVDEVALFMAGPPNAEKAAFALQHHLRGLTLLKTDCRPVGTDTMWRLRRA